MIPQRPAAPANPNLQFDLQFEGPSGNRNPNFADDEEDLTEEPRIVMKRNWTGTIIGGAVFYVLLVGGIGLFLLNLNSSRDQLLKDLDTYEKRQPTYVSQQLFSNVFSAPDWGAIYDQAGLEVNRFEGREAFVAFMDNKVAGSALTYQKLPQEEDGRIPYEILLQKEAIARFYMKNQSDDPQSPRWELDGIQVFFEGQGTYRISGSSACVVKVNGVQLDDRSLVQRTGRIFTEDLGELSKQVELPGTSLYEVSGLLVKPTVTVEDSEGRSLEVTYDEATATFSAPLTEEAMPDEARKLALDTVTTYCKFMIKKATHGDLFKYFNPNTDTYRAITASDLTWIQKESGHSTADEKVTDYVRLDEDHFSIHVSLTWQLTRKDGSIKKSPVDETLLFAREASGKWRCQRMTGKDFTEPFNTVRVRFMHDDTVISSVLVKETDKTITCPAVGIPEGRKLAGWVTVMQDAEGKDYYQRVLSPDASGLANVPGGLFEKPVDLYPVHVAE